MESAAVRVLALLGLAAVAVCLALLCARPLAAALDGVLKKWRRLGIVPRVVAVLMAAIATVEAQKSGMGDSNHVERVESEDGEIKVVNPQVGTDLHKSICGDKCGFEDCNNGETLHVSTRSTRLISSLISHHPSLISLQLELFPNGDYIARSNNVERYYKRINPDDFMIMI